MLSRFFASHADSVAPEEGASPDRRRRFAGIFAATTVTGLALAALVPVQAGATAFSGSGCAAVNIIVARASTEAAGQGITGNLVTAVQNASNQTVSAEAVNYPATLQNYASSESQGVTNGKSELHTAVANCPNQKQVLMGYSQGANVVEDMVTGNAEVGPSTVVAAAPASDLSHVVAIVDFGDPGFVRGQAFDLGTNTANNGRFARSSSQVSALNSFGGASKIASWCDTGDPFCAGGNNLNTHLTYLNRYQTAAQNFTIGKIGG